MIVTVPSSGSSTFRRQDADAVGIPVIIEMRDIELADIADIKKLVSSVSWRPLTDGTFFPTAIFNPRLGKVEIFTDAPSYVFQELLDAFPKKAVMAGRSLEITSRKADIEPHYGGARLRRPGGSWKCTSGFAVLTASLQERMVTAGHCFSEGQTVESPYGTSFGTVKPLVATWPSPDVELIGGSGIDQGPQVYNGNSVDSEDYANVLGAADPTISYGAYCFSGANSHNSSGGQFENCYLSFNTANEDLDGSVYYADCDCDRYIARYTRLTGATSYGSCPGDSGAPVYRYLSNLTEIRIVGMVFGGSNHLSMPRDQSSPTLCEVHAQTDALIFKWSQIRDAYDVSIMSI
jgi:hypothetical protein